MAKPLSLSPLSPTSLSSLSLPLQLLLKSLQVGVVVQAHAVVGRVCPKTFGVVVIDCNVVGEVGLVLRLSPSSAPVSICKLIY